MTHLKHVSTITIAILIVLFAVPAFAHQTGEPHPHPIKAESKPLDVIKARAQQIKENVGVRVDMGAEAKMQLRASTSASTTRPKIPGREGLKSLVRMHGGLIRERFTNALSHLTKFMTRIETRIEKMKAAGVDVGVVESLQVNAEVAIDAAETDIADVRTYIESVDESTDRAAVKAELSVKIKEARESIRAAHEAVRKVVAALVALAKENRPDASLEVDAEIE